MKNCYENRPNFPQSMPGFLCLNPLTVRKSKMLMVRLGFKKIMRQGKELGCDTGRPGKKIRIWIWLKHCYSATTIYVSFGIRLTSLSIIFSMFIHFVACVRILFSFLFLDFFVFWMGTVFNVFIEFVKMLPLFYVLLYLATRHVGS